MLSSFKMLLWDSLFVLLVFAPLVSGGIWLHQPGLHLEYTQAGFAALALAAWLLWAKKRGRVPAKESWACALGLRAWDFWGRELASRPFRTLLIAWLCFSSLWFTTSLIRHLAFGSGLADMGIFTNGIWNVSHVGFPYSSIKDGRSLLADHQIFLLYPIGWLFALWPDPIFLLLLQAFGLCTGAIALYALGRQRLGASHPVLPWLPIAYWLCGPLRAANLFDFHPEVFMLPLFLFAAFFLQEAAWRKRILGGALLLAAIAAKESAGPVAAGLGLAWLLGAGPEPTRAFTRSFGQAVMVLGCAAFAFDLRAVPAFFGTHYAYLGNYSGQGFFLFRLISIARLKFLLGCLLPTSFLPLLSPAAALVALPGFLMLFLSEGDHRISLGYHYAIEPLTGLFFALPVALDSRFARARTGALLPIFVLASLLSYGRSEPYFWRVYSTIPHHVWVRTKALPLIPQERSVSASYGLVPHLSTRHWVHQVPIIVDENKRPVDCVVWDYVVNNTPMTQKDIYTLPITLSLFDYREEFHCGAFVLYRRLNGPSCLSGPLQCPEDGK